MLRHARACRGIHVFFLEVKFVDGRVKPGNDDNEWDEVP
jgi:hypothetical protein